MDHTFRIDFGRWTLSVITGGRYRWGRHGGLHAGHAGLGRVVLRWTHRIPTTERRYRIRHITRPSFQEVVAHRQASASTEEG